MSQITLPSLTFPENTLMKSALAAPFTIDTLLTENLFTDPPKIPIGTFAAFLSEHLNSSTSGITGTPPIHWANPADYDDSEEDYETRHHRDPTLSPSQLFIARVHATLLGRAIALSYGCSTSVPKRVNSELWQLARSIFQRADLTGVEIESQDADPGVRYASAIIVLTCGQALAQIPSLRGRGKGWDRFNSGFHQPDAVFGWDDIRASILATENLPRGNTDFREVLTKFWEEYAPPGYDKRGNLVGVGNEGGVGAGGGDGEGGGDGHVAGEEGRRGSPVYEVESRSKTDVFEQRPRREVVFPEWVQKEVLEAFDMAREHLRSGRGDLGAWEIQEIFSGSIDGGEV